MPPIVHKELIMKKSGTRMTPCVLLFGGPSVPPHVKWTYALDQICKLLCEAPPYFTVPRSWHEYKRSNPDQSHTIHTHDIP